MANERESIRFLPNQPLRDAQRQATSMSLPLPVLGRLALIADLAADVSATRAEIVGMLIANADLEVEQLEREIVDYRKKTVGAVLPPVGDHEIDGNVIQMAAPRRGRPPKR